jgi:predicted acyltransferase
MLSGLFAIGCLLLFTGFCWDMVFPINKKIWSSSFVVYTTGMAILVLCVLIYFIEMRPTASADPAVIPPGRTPRWTRFFDVFGKNALFIFAISGILPRLMALCHIADGVKPDGSPLYKGLKEYMVDHFFIPVFGNMNGSLLYAVCTILLFWLLCYWLDKKKIYIKV